jgi:hypothetical protein
MNKLLIVGTVALTQVKPTFSKQIKFWRTATYIGLSACFFLTQSAIVSVVGDDFPAEYLDLLTDRNIDMVLK